MTKLLCLSLLLAGCTVGESGSKTTTGKQLVECTMAPDGTMSCDEVDQPSGMPGTCVDVEDDDDDSAAEPDDDDGDGVMNEDDDDDDDDGIPDTDDCDQMMPTTGS